MWEPPLIHINSVDGKSVFAKEDDVIQISGNIVDPSNSIIQAYRVTDTYLTSSCSSFSFKNFPFDQLTCDIVIDIDMPNDFLKVVEAAMNIDKSQTGIVDPADVWDFIGINTTVVQVPFLYGIEKIKDRIYFTVTLKRKYQYYITNILLPIWLLFALQISILVLPPELPERPSYSVTMVLAYAVSLTYVLDQIPQTTETVYLIVLIDLHIVFSGLFTLYLFIISTLAVVGNVKKLRYFDLVFGTSTVVLVVSKDLLLIAFMIYEM